MTTSQAIPPLCKRFLARTLHLEVNWYLGICIVADLLHLIAHTGFVAEVVGSPGWTEEHPGERLGVRGESLCPAQVLCRL